jgi:hypothetical protein
MSALPEGGGPITLHDVWLFAATFVAISDYRRLDRPSNLLSNK